MKKSRIICYAKNVKNHAIFVEGFSPEIHARRRFMKFSMSLRLIYKNSVFFQYLGIFGGFEGDE